MTTSDAGHREGFTIMAVDSHRNGVGGNAFTVAIISDDEDGRMLVIDMHGVDGGMAVLNLDQAVTGNIFMFPQVDESGDIIPDTGGNAWRGDVLGDKYRDEMRRLRDEHSAAQIERWEKRNRARDSE